MEQYCFAVYFKWFFYVLIYLKIILSLLSSVFQIIFLCIKVFKNYCKPINYYVSGHLLFQRTDFEIPSCCKIWSYCASNCYNTYDIKLCNCTLKFTRKCKFLILVIEKIFHALKIDIQSLSFSSKFWFNFFHLYLYLEFVFIVSCYTTKIIFFSHSKYVLLSIGYFCFFFEHLNNCYILSQFPVLFKRLVEIAIWEILMIF